GTLVVASRTANLFRGHKDRQHILHVLANQIAGSLDNARMYRELEAMATTDGLTGLTNRRAFQERLTEMLGRAERHGRPLTLLLCDIDHFKKINDTYGHPVGDTVLKRVAQVVAAQVRKIDIAARYGGEEFAVVLESTDQEGGRQLAERIRQEVQKLVLAQEQGGGTFGCTLSLGISTFPSDGQDGRLLIQRADQALYYAKRNGRNRAVAFGEVAAEIKTAA
nr:GGDEF domain-containing protein [Deltaproteobacteria bacterium]